MPLAKAGNAQESGLTQEDRKDRNLVWHMLFVKFPTLLVKLEKQDPCQLDVWMWDSGSCNLEITGIEISEYIIYYRPMSMCACMYEYVCVSIWVCELVWLYARVTTCMCVFACLWVCSRVGVCKSVWMDVCVWVCKVEMCEWLGVSLGVYEWVWVCMCFAGNGRVCHEFKAVITDKRWALEEYID